MLIGVRRDEHGATLIELLVVMVLLGVVGSITVQGIVTALQSSARTQARIEATHETEIAVQRVSRDLRAAAPLEVYAGTDPREHLTTFVSHGGEGFQVTYTLELAADGTRQLQQATVPVDEDDEAIGPRQVTLMTLVDNETDPVFRYYRADGSEVTCSPADCMSDYLGASQVGLRLEREVAGQDPVVVETRTAIRSIRYRSVLP